MKKLLLAIGAGFAAAAGAGDVTFSESSTVLPTYAPGGYDKTPIFFTGRVYRARRAACITI